MPIYGDRKPNGPSPNLGRFMIFMGGRGWHNLGCEATRGFPPDRSAETRAFCGFPGHLQGPGNDESPSKQPDRGNGLGGRDWNNRGREATRGTTQSASAETESHLLPARPIEEGIYVDLSHPRSHDESYHLRVVARDRKSGICESAKVDCIEPIINLKIFLTFFTFQMFNLANFSLRF